MKRLFALLLLAASTQIAQAQNDKDIFGPAEAQPKRNGFVIGLNGNFDIPGGDMADRFGLSYRLGPSLLYKTKSNWIFGVKTDFIFGSKIKDDSILFNIRDHQGSFLDEGGQRTGMGIYERGYMIGLQAGKILTPFRNKDNGILLMTSTGFIQHKVSLYNNQQSIPQVRGSYRKGYDRLTNGWFVEQFVGFNHFASNSIIHYYIGLDIMAGFTKGRRDYQYDIMRADKDSRVDLLFGIRGGWYIPMFKRKSEEIFFE